MPPKKKQETSKKADQKKKEKIIEDKTFGLKNKKGAKTQKYIQQVQHQVKYGNQPKRQLEQQTVSKKDEKKKELEELNQIFRPVATQKIDKGVDPKSVLCAFFKSGQCSKGDKCKFSHDLTVERKSEKKSLYCDTRNEDDNMENWDDDKLKEVVEKKHGEREKKLPTTDIICKYFLEAIETNKYGWFWTCPNGGDNCHYRHALPPGFVLKKDKKKEKKEDITIEELVEIERSKLGYNLTKITLESFNEWKKKKRKEKQEKDRSETDRKKAEFKAGKNIGLSGREMFTFNPDLAVDNDMDEGEAAMDIVREQDENDDDNNVKEIDIDEIELLAKESDNSGTQCTDMKRNFSSNNHDKDGDNNYNNNNKNNKETEKQQQQQRIAKGNDDNNDSDNDNNNNDDDIINEPIDESLFAEEAELFDELENELGSVKIEN